MAKHEFGRLYARNLLTNCIVATCTRSPYPNLADDGGAEDKIKPMISLSRDNWKQIKTEFMVLRNLAVRKDTKTTFDFLLDNASVQKLSDPGDVDEKLDCAKFFKGSHDRLRKRFEIQEAVAPIRERLEIAVANKTEPSVIQDDIDDILYVPTP